MFRKKKKADDPPVKEATISAVVHRADGTVEDLGVISRGPVEFVPERKDDGKDQG